MLYEYLSNQKHISWNSSLPGVKICQFHLQGCSQDKRLKLSVLSNTHHFEAFFCSGGQLIVESTSTCPVILHAQGIFLLSDESKLCSIQISQDLQGVLIAVNPSAAQSSLSSICHILGLKLDIHAIRQKITNQNGYTILTDIPWAKALFEDLRRLPPDHREGYCVFKTVELLYLFCANTSTAGVLSETSSNAYPSLSISQVRAYLESHLEEKHTIPSLCHRFSLSPTSLKTGFRRMYGQPLHRWLTQQRIHRACELLRQSNLPILTVAQAVGYDSASQFSVVFKRYCGMTPGQFKKMSDSGDPSLF